MKTLILLSVLLLLACCADPKVDFQLNKTKIQYTKDQTGCNWDVVLSAMLAVNQCASTNKYTTTGCIQDSLSELFED